MNLQILLQPISGNEPRRNWKPTAMSEGLESAQPTQACWQAWWQTVGGIV